MARVVVYHSGYGCDTGCCGHIVEIDDEQVGNFDFGHPDDSTPESAREYVKRLVTDECGAEHVADIDWDSCKVVYD